MKLLYSVTFLLFCSITLCAQSKLKDYEKIVDSMKLQKQENKIAPFLLNEIKLNPKNEKALLQLVMFYIKDKKQDLATKYSKDLLKINSKCTKCLVVIANAYIQQNKLDLAQENINKVFRIDSNFADAFAVQAIIKLNQNDELGAYLDINQAVKLNDSNAQFFIIRGKISMMQKSYSSALADFNKALSLEPANNNALIGKAYVNIDKENFKEAASILDLIINNDSTFEGAIKLKANCNYMMQDFNNALQNYKRAFIINPSDFEALYAISNCYYSQENMDSACIYFQKSLDLLNKVEPTNVENKKTLLGRIGNLCNEQIPSYYYQRGIANYNLKQFKEALKIYSKGVNKFPTNTMMLTFKANAFMAINEYNSAMQDYELAIKNQTTLIDDIKFNQNIIGLNLDSLKEFNDLFLKSIEINIAECLLGLNKSSEALVKLNKALENPVVSNEFNLDQYYNVRGNIYLVQYQHKLALQDFEKCIEVNKQNPIYYYNKALSRLLSCNVKYKGNIENIGNLNQKFLISELEFPKDMTTKFSEFLVAITDLNKAINLFEKFESAYFLRGQIKQALNDPTFCLDIQKAKELNFVVPVSFDNSCR